MNLRVFLITVLLAFILVPLTPPAGYAGEVPGVEKDTIKIGEIGDFSGPIVDVAGELIKGGQAYFRHLNRTGGINGRKVKVIAEDDRYSVPLALSAFKKLAFKDKVFMISGHGSAGPVAMIHLITQEKIPALHMAASRQLTSPVKRYIFTGVPSAVEEAYVMIDFIMEKLKGKEPRIALFSFENVVGRNYLKGANERAKMYGIKPVAESIVGLSSIDSTSNVLTIKRAKPNYIALFGTTATGTIFLRDAQKFGLDVPVLGCTWACDKSVIEQAGKKATKNYIATNYSVSWLDDDPGILKLRKIIKEFSPGTKFRNRSFVKGWARALALAEALKRSGRDITREKMVEALESLKGFDPDGIAAPITFNTTKHCGVNSWKFFKTDLENARFTSFTGWREPASMEKGE